MCERLADFASKRYNDGIYFLVDPSSFKLVPHLKPKIGALGPLSKQPFPFTCTLTFETSAEAAKRFLKILVFSAEKLYLKTKRTHID